MTHLAGTLSDQIRTMLGDGIEPIAIARALGCEPSYISQLMEDEDFKAAVQQQRVINLTDATGRDKKLSRLEDLAIERLEATLGFVTRPMEAARILSIVNGTKRRGAELNGAQAQGSAPTVVLNLPQAARVSFTLNASSQIIDVEGRSMAPLPNNKLLELAAARKQQAANALPKPRDTQAASDIYARIGAPDVENSPLPQPAPVRNVLDLGA
jgi:hypothetical protein